MVMECIMWQRSLKNQLFRSEVMMIDCFPLFFNIPNMMPPQQMLPQAPVEQGKPGIWKKRSYRKKLVKLLECLQSSQKTTRYK